jgi:hypothetical protein
MKCRSTSVRLRGNIPEDSSPWQPEISHSLTCFSFITRVSISVFDFFSVLIIYHGVVLAFLLSFTSIYHLFPESLIYSHFMFLFTTRALFKCSFSLFSYFFSVSVVWFCLSVSRVQNRRSFIVMHHESLFSEPSLCSASLGSQSAVFTSVRRWLRSWESVVQLRH